MIKSHLLIKGAQTRIRIVGDEYEVDDEPIAGKYIIDDVWAMVQTAQPGDRLTFTGEKYAATGAGDVVQQTYYFVGFGPMLGKEGAYLSKTKAGRPTHGFIPKHRGNLGAILPLNLSSKRPNAMTLGYIYEVVIT